MKQDQATALLESPVEITIIRDGRPLMNQTFQHSPIQIGRILANDIVLPFDSVSRFHCELRFENQKWTLVDLKSMNGMKVNGQQVTSATFEKSGEFEIKPVTLRFQVQEPHPLNSVFDEVTVSNSGVISSSDETLVGTDAILQRRPLEGKRLHSALGEHLDGINQTDPAPTTPVKVGRSPLLELDGTAIFSDVYPAIEKSKLNAVQITVAWYDVILSVDEFFLGEEMIIEINGIFLRLGRVGNDRAEIRCPTGTNFVNRPGSESILLPSNPACWESSDGIRIMARFVPQSKQMRNHFLPEIAEELVDPLVLSGTIHGIAALASLAINTPPSEKQINQPERIAHIIQAVPTPNLITSNPPLPSPTQAPSSQTTPQPVVAKQPTPVQQARRQTIHEKKLQPTVAPLNEQNAAAKFPQPQPMEKTKSSTKPDYRPSSPKAGVPIAATPKPFQANSVGALKALTLLSVAPVQTSERADVIIARRSISSRDDSAGKGADTSMSNMINQFPADRGDSSSTVGGLVLDVSKGGTGYGTSGYSGKAGKRSVMGSVIGGATYSESTKDEGLTRDQVMAIVQKHQGQIQQCYERSLKTDAHLSGRAEIEWEITAHGAVNSVSVKDTNLRNAESLLECVKDVFKKMIFPTAKNGASTTPTIGLPFGRL